MTGLSEQQLAEIRADLNAVPAPPWRWIGNRGAGGPQLVTDHSGRHYLLHAAKPTDGRGDELLDPETDCPVYGDLKFRDQRPGEQYSTMRTGDQLAIGRTDYDPDSIVGVDNPVARWVERSAAHATALLAEVERLRSERDAFADRVDTLTAVAKGNKRHVVSLLTSLTAIEKQARESDTDLTGTRLSLWEEEQETARLRLALASAQRGRRKQRARVAALETERHTTNEALDSSMRAIRAAHAAALAEAADEFERRTAPTGERLVGKAAVIRFLRDRVAALTGGAQ